MCGIAGYSLRLDSCVDRTLAAQALLAGIAERGADAVGYAHRTRSARDATVVKQRSGASELLEHIEVPQDATQLLVHGVQDADGRALSLFAFACRPGSAGPRQTYLAQLLAPSMHAAWVRTQLQRRAENGGAGERAGGGSILTVRELDILKWIYLGKSNYEIGAILKISPLTVKNHVQKILRKLNVVNRTQAVGKSLELRLLNP